MEAAWYDALEVNGLTVSVAILGSTGSIGTQTLDVIRSLRANGWNIEVTVLAAGRRTDRLAQQIWEFRPRLVAVADQEAAEDLRRQLGDLRGMEVHAGQRGMQEAAAYPSDVVVNAIGGAAGLLATWHAVRRGARIALANKESLVAAGELVMQEAARAGAAVIPVDSEHSALFQCLLAGRREEVEAYVLTASGGPFRTWDLDQLRQVKPADALCHPNWQMGPKITVDSATLMNKGLEVIEAHHLFGASYDMIKVVVHPQSVVHSLVAYRDGALMAQLGAPDMRIPIQYAITYPYRETSPWKRLDLAAAGALTFEPPNEQRFPCLRLAYDAGRAGTAATCVLNAANEVAVDAFLHGRLPFLGIPALIEAVLGKRAVPNPATVEDVWAIDAEARSDAREWLRERGCGP
ncbi:MAG: 1-deoxy-D-xylulose-5-phosphate reductoisomerase [Thermoflavifilum sp.]|nr:1-deoxy-D-xylulose-5-phosphate reductoisomerase [Thermoflavifilum sp.]MCL6513408.1 1-deoxy-D-xylulose-5-phosphate reductoisomerase [Alicyclobacillus sp.]